MATVIPTGKRYEVDPSALDWFIAASFIVCAAIGFIWVLLRGIDAIRWAADLDDRIDRIEMRQDRNDASLRSWANDVEDWVNDRVPAKK